IISASDLLSQVVPLRGLLTETKMDPHRQDMVRAVEIAGRIGALDIGQAAIVARGIVLGVESVEGTDAMLARVGELSEEVRGTPDARAGVLAKIPKPQQDRRIDLPAMGPQTIAGAARAGLAGIVFEADGVLFEAPDACIEQANRAGLFLYGLTPEEL
ncbi:MAG: LpxI family protein, partial [Pseudomonadota bacterium]|nr:LpxI family protein [Pseudomonadota bacterium]